MSRTRRDEPDEDEEDWDDGDDYDPEDPETYPAGLYDDDGPATVPCPHCRAEILEDSERCPRCGEYLSAEDAPRQVSGTAWVVLVLMLVAILLTVLGIG
ncbi:zinc ribbon domain-containing protein [Gemmata sp.]|uniref:zinc ribbon domain-containing protein n=1 Tax=Gemmata sp. TaxID=1914242 RepID=UPI003F727678